MPGNFVATVRKVAGLYLSSKKHIIEKTDTPRPLERFAGGLCGCRRQQLSLWPPYMTWVRMQKRSAPKSCDDPSVQCADVVESGSPIFANTLLAFRLMLVHGGSTKAALS